MGLVLVFGSIILFALIGLIAIVLFTGIILLVIGIIMERQYKLKGENRIRYTIMIVIGSVMVAISITIILYIIKGII